MRLAKYLAHAGVASRRAAERMVREGRVAVDGEVVTDPAREVDGTREVTVDGAAVEPEAREVRVLNKPAGVVSTARDTHGRPTVTDLVASEHRLYPVGRLDADTTGLILLTNDGELANRLVHPRYQVEKVYSARVEPCPVAEAALRCLREGVELEDGMTLPARVRQVAPGQLEIALREGRNRQVRRMCEAVGHRAMALERIAFGPLRLEGLAEGASRRLSAAELERLRAAAGLVEHRERSGRGRDDGDGGGARILARAKGYPYDAAPTSFVVVGEGTYELTGLGPSAPSEGLAGAQVRDPASGEERPLAELDPRLAPGALRERLPLLAYGANRSPEALVRKRGLPGFPVDEPIVALRARLHDIDIVYSAHLSDYGAVASTIQHSPGTAVDIALLLVTEAQLAVLNETEHNYTVEELSELALNLEGGGRLDRALGYVSRHGCLLVNGSERALTAIPAYGRRLEGLTEPEAIAAAAAQLGHDGKLDDLILAVAGDYEAAAARTRELRRGARPLAWPHRRLRATAAAKPTPGVGR